MKNIIPKYTIENILKIIRYWAARSFTKRKFNTAMMKEKIINGDNFDCLESILFG
ncbi:hypothetical protein ACFL2X_03155 [Candidatus Latescibacterota bacterium]